MNPGDIVIAVDSGSYTVKVRGRANFDYAVPLREVVSTLDDYKSFVFDLGECITMDSTFMGVLTMLALKGYQKNKPVELWGSSPEVAGLLKELGVARLFEFHDGTPPPPAGESCAPAASTHKLALAETVAEAHRKLVEAAPANAGVFDAVIKYAEEDLDRLKNQAED